MPQTTDDIVKAIQSDVEGITSKMLADLIETHQMKTGKRQKSLWDRYTLEDVPIYHRKQAKWIKIDRKIADDFYANIVDTKTGYMGNEVVVSLNREEYTTEKDVDGQKEKDFKEDEYNKDMEHLRDFQTQTNSLSGNSKMVGTAGAVGVGYRLLYVPKGKNETRTMNLDPWEVIYIFDESLDEAVLAIRYYSVEEKLFNDMKNQWELTDITIVEVYDDTYITYYIDDGQHNFRLDNNKGNEEETEEGTIRTGQQPHLFDGVPIIPFDNNDLQTGEPEKVQSLIDGYDAIMSSTVSEIEQFRLAYMFAKGAGMLVDDKFVKQLEQTGIFPLSEDGEIGFINKELAVEGVKVITEEIRRNIYQFAKSIDMSKDIAGDMRVLGWQIALFPMENSAIVTERLFTKALREEYRMLTTYWKKYNSVEIDPKALEYTFTRNFPQDLAGEAEILDTLLGNVSTHTAYSQMSFIDDPDQEIRKQEAERNAFRDSDKGFIEEGEENNPGAPEVNE
jgi:SPP1 family phage portal protein